MISGMPLCAHTDCQSAGLTYSAQTSVKKFELETAVQASGAQIRGQGMPRTGPVILAPAMVSPCSTSICRLLSMSCALRLVNDLG